MDLRNIFRRKPAPIPRIVFSRSKAAARKAVEADHDITAKLVSELSAQGKYVPPSLRNLDTVGQG